MHEINEIVKRFETTGEFVEVKPYGTGHINDTYLSTFKNDSGHHHYIHQRINHEIFTKPAELMENICRVTEHLKEKFTQMGEDTSRRCLSLVQTRSGEMYHVTEDGNYWRTYNFITGARTYDKVENLDHVNGASRAFAEFQMMVSDLPGEPLHETIPDFGNARFRFEQFRQALDADSQNRAQNCQPEIQFALDRKEITDVIEDLISAGKLPRRIAHYDTKFNNVMIDDKTGEGICVIDLDTVMPGTVTYDFGDSVRIGASTAAEDETDLSKVSMNLEMFDRLAQGYLSIAKDFLTDVEIDHLAFSAKLITFVIGLRFLADHLAGDVYFKTHREGHNLDRARTQFKMVADMESKFDKMQEIIRRYAQRSAV